MTTIVQSAMTAVVPVPDLSSVETQLAVQNLRSVINNNSSYIRAVDGIADEFADATGVDGTASSNLSYDATSDYYTTGQVEVIPTMTSDTAPSGTMSVHANNDGSTAWEAADKSLGTVWTAPSGNQLGWLAYEATTPSVVTKYKIINHSGVAARGLVAWTFEGYNGSGWDVLDTQSSQPVDTLNTVRYYTFTNTTAYAKHRINISANGGDAYTQVAEIQFYFGGGDMTLVSDTFTAETAPTESSAVFLHQPVDAVTLNTDILGYISRDAGTTWTLGTLVDAGSFDSTTNILTMNAVDISGQPSGTSMKYKIVTANTKEQRLHGAWLAWS
tara:strand:+ start:420 stop:1406 length:987 start_codon:yes stop_codon:yes gene_type:complete